MSEETDAENALENDLKTSSEEEKEVVREGLGKTTAIDRQFIRDQVAEGLMKPSEAAAKFSISPQYVSKLLRTAGIRFGSRKLEREEKEKLEKETKEAAAKANFAARKAGLSEEHKMSAAAQLRSAFLLEGVRQKKWREAAMAPGGGLPSVKEAMTSARTMAVLDQRIRILLELDNIVDERELPGILLEDMGDAEIAAARRGPRNEDADLAKLDDDIVEELA